MMGVGRVGTPSPSNAVAAEKCGACGNSDTLHAMAATCVPSAPRQLIHRAVLDSRNPDAAAFSNERRHPVQLVDLPSCTISMTIGRLLPGQKSRRHRHNYETLLYICAGRGVTFIEDQAVEWEAGDAVYIPVWAWHCHENLMADADCLYVACENAPLLQNLGGIALRQEL